MVLLNAQVQFLVRLPIHNSWIAHACTRDYMCLAPFSGWVDSGVCFLVSNIVHQNGHFFRSMQIVRVCPY